MISRAAIGLDLGGTNLKGALVDDHARILCKHSIPTDAARGPDAVIADMVAMTEQLIQKSGLDRSAIVGIGVGSPGPLSMKHGIIYHCANLPGWNHVPLRQRLHEKTGLAVVLENDGNAAAYGEYWSRFIEKHATQTHPPLPRGESGGSSHRHHGSDLVLLTLGTGVGAGVIIEGRVLHGHFENAAELGHTIVVVDGLPCPCGQRGCLEQYSSASAIARRVTAAIRVGAQSALRDDTTHGCEIDSSMVAEQARTGDVLCTQIWDEACKFLAIACINIQHSFNPEQIILGGGLAAAGDFLLHAVRKHFESRQWVLCRDFPTISISQIGTDIGSIGAAGLAWAEATDQPIS